MYARLVRSWSRWEDEIKKDLDRTYPHHIFFVEQSGPGKEALFNCLKAYSLYDPEVLIELIDLGIVSGKTVGGVCSKYGTGLRHFAFGDV